MSRDGHRAARRSRHHPRTGGKRAQMDKNRHPQVGDVGRGGCRGQDSNLRPSGSGSGAIRLGHTLLHRVASHGGHDIVSAPRNGVSAPRAAHPSPAFENFRMRFDDLAPGQRSNVHAAGPIHNPSRPTMDREIRQPAALRRETGNENRSAFAAGTQGDVALGAAPGRRRTLRHECWTVDGDTLRLHRHGRLPHRTRYVVEPWVWHSSSSPFHPPIYL